MGERALVWQETAAELVAAGRWRAGQWLVPASRATLVVGIVTFGLGASASEALPVWVSIGPLVLIAVGAVLSMQTSNRALRAAVPEGSTQVRLRAGPEGLVRERGPVVETVPWAAVPRLERSGPHLLLQVGRSAVAIPESVGDLDALQADLKEWHAAARPAPAPPADALTWPWSPAFEHALLVLRAPQLEGRSVGAAIFAALCGAGLGATTLLSLAAGLGMPTDVPFVLGSVLGLVAGLIVGLPGALGRLVNRLSPPAVDQLGVRISGAGLEVWTDAGHTLFAWSIVRGAEQRGAHVALLTRRGAVAFAVPVAALSDVDGFIAEVSDSAGRG
jgi:hypothetical protein